ncbi:hypothetical protein BV20DRAFT_1035887 [Pilatotrama ljubarskyi]|nr:hypothetical protein BV20DRAFT_1035887 [Pilatotrama ljubarskyi]
MTMTTSTTPDSTRLNSPANVNQDPRTPPQEVLDDSLDGLPALLDCVLDLESRELIPAFRELPTVRLLYLQVVLANIFGSATVEEAERRLKDGLDLLELSRPDGLPARPKPAESLITAKRRLGLNVDDYIEKRAICTVCFKPYSSEDIAQSDSPTCVVRKCPGIFYSTKREADGTERRVPAKIHAYVSLIKTIQRFLLRPDFVNALTLPSQKLRKPPLENHESMHDFHDGVAFSSYKLGLERVKLSDGTVADVAIRRGTQRTLMSVDIGLSMTINVDWYGVTEGRPHSVGGIYVTFNNLHRSVRYLQHNVHLSSNTPGPKEPTSEQLTHLIEPLYDEAKVLYDGALTSCSSGARMAIDGRRDPGEVFGGIKMRVCDLPGSRKLEAFAAHNHKENPCFFCKLRYEDINDPSGYDIENFELRDDWEQVKHAFASRDATTARARKQIFEEHGQRWAKFFELPGWTPSGCAIDFMHNFYLGIAKEMYVALLVRGHLLNKEMWRRVETLVNSIQWPSGIGRLPTNLGENHGFAKADQWRRWVNVQCTVLWTVWGDAHDVIRRNPPDIPANTKNVESFCRDDLRDIYEVFLFLSLAERILASKSISMDDVERGHRYLRLCCVQMLRLGVHLLPNHHLAMHYPIIFKLFGPVYAWWLYAHERFNGIQEKVRTNGKAAGEMELTLTRSWVAKQRLYELLSSLPESATDRERMLIDRVISTNTESSGTLRSHMFTASDSTVKAPRQVKKYSDLRKLPHPDVYQLLLTFLQELWPELRIADDFNLESDCLTFSSTRSARVFPVLSVDSTRYGSIMDKRSSADRFGCVDFRSSRVPCKILYHFGLSVGNSSVTCSVVQRLISDDNIPAFPWSLYAMDLGVYSPEVILSSQLAAPVAIIPITSRVLGSSTPLWAVHSFDRTGIEPEDEWFNTLSDEIDNITDNDI